MFIIYSLIMIIQIHGQYYYRKLIEFNKRVQRDFSMIIWNGETVEWFSRREIVK